MVLSDEMHLSNWHHCWEHLDFSILPGSEIVVILCKSRLGRKAKKKRSWRTKSFSMGHLCWRHVWGGTSRAESRKHGRFYARAYVLWGTFAASDFMQQPLYITYLETTYNFDLQTRLIHLLPLFRAWPCRWGTHINSSRSSM